MAFASWIQPDSLYNSSVSTIVRHFKEFCEDIKILPDNLLFDIYYKLYRKGRLCDLSQQFSTLSIFERLLRVSDKRLLLHRCFQAVIDHGQNLPSVLADEYSCQRCSAAQSRPNLSSDRECEKTIQLGFNLGAFLTDAGWFNEAETILKSCLHLCERRIESIDPGERVNVSHRQVCVDCRVKIMHVQNTNCKYSEAQAIWTQIQPHLADLPDYNRATLYTEYCSLLFAQSQYDTAYEYCHKALQVVRQSPAVVSHRQVVDIFRQCAKTCVVKREFKKAGVLIKFAVQHAVEHFGVKHHKYSDALLDYGFFLLNVDYIPQAVEIYQAALDIRLSVFGGKNIHIAIAHEDLAYSTYVNEYSSGKFDKAKEHAETAINLISSILPPDHLALASSKRLRKSNNCKFDKAKEHAETAISLISSILPPDHLALASSKRVKALILEEVAIDCHNKSTGRALLKEAQDLHLSSLSLATRAFGENNVQTAKHYGNLGRLYQSMHRYKEAEEMHIKSIRIKENLLGSDDYEVALSVGHLASLYNYDMHKYSQAEELYLRSIQIGLQLFGEAYSGLEYDYRGLLKLYQTQGNHDKCLQYGAMLQEWNTKRDTSHIHDMRPLELKNSHTLSDVLELFFTITEKK